MIQYQSDQAKITRSRSLVNAKALELLTQYFHNEKKSVFVDTPNVYSSVTHTECAHTARDTQTFTLPSLR